MKRKKVKRTFRPVHVILIIIAVICVYYAACCADILSCAGKDDKQPADAVIVLGAGSYDGVISPVFRERINHGVWLYKNGYAGTVILTGGYGTGSNCSDARAAMLYAVECGVDRDDILLEESSSITQENIENAKALMDENGLASAVIVSDPIHMRRAMLMAQDCGMQAYSSPTPTTRYITWKTKLPFLVRELFFYTGYRICRVFS